MRIYCAFTLLEKVFDGIRSEYQREADDLKSLLGMIVCPIRKECSNRVKERNFLIGFTLIELLVVVIVIGILATLAIPQYNKIPIKTKTAKAKSSLAILTQAEKIYRTENDKYIDVAKDTANDTVGDAVSGISLQALDNDSDWDYDVSGAIAKATKVSDQCKSKTVTLDMSTGIYTVDKCL